MRRNSLKLSVGHCRESRGLPLVHHIPPPVMPLDMPQSLCALDRAGTGKEGSSAKRESHREKLRNDGWEEWGNAEGESDKIVPDGWRGGKREKMC